MADEKWSAFPSHAGLLSSDILVGLRSGANVQFSSVTGTFVLLAPSADQTITGAHNLIMATGSMVAPTMLPGNLSLSGNSIISTNTDGNIYIIPNGSGLTQGLTFFGNSTPIDSDSSSLIQATSVQRVAAISLMTNWNADSGASVYLSASRSNVPGSLGAVSNTQILGAVISRGDDGVTGLQDASNIQTAVDGTVSSGIVPGRINFFTANSSGVTTLGMYLDASQILTLINPLSTGSGGTGFSGPYTTNNLIYASSSTALASLATANNGVLITSSGGVPSISSTLPSAVQGNITTLGDLVAYTTLAIAATGAAVNGIIMSNNNDGAFVMQAGDGSAAHGGAYTMFGANHASFPGWTKACISSQTGSKFAINNGGFGASGSDVLTVDRSGNIVAASIDFSTTSGIIGTTTNDSAATGSVGEDIFSTVNTGIINLTTATSTNITTISLTEGDWDVWGSVCADITSTTVLVYLSGWASSTSATLPITPLTGNVNYGAGGFTYGGNATITFAIPQQLFKLASTTTIYLSCQADFSVGTMAAYGSIYARRRR